MAENKMPNDDSNDKLNWFAEETLKYMYNVAFPTQKFVYPASSDITPNSQKPDYDYTLWEFETVTLENDQLIKTPKQARYFLEDLGNNVLLEMIEIPGGSFFMGSPDTEESDYDYYNTPQHLVNVPSFHMGKYVVTQQQWEALMEHNLSLPLQPNLPVVNVSWCDAVEFCRRLSLKTGRNYRLPSEAEWEYACRGQTTTSYNFGDEITTTLANYWDINGEYDDETSQDPPEWGVGTIGPNGIKYLQLAPVGSFFPNAFGLYDMHGNVYELCEDAFHWNYEGVPTDGSA